MTGLQTDFNLQPHHTFALPAKADFALPLTDLTSLALLPEAIKTLPRWILGGGSNIVFTRDISGLIVLVQNKGITLLDENESSVTLKVAAGESWHDFVQYCVQNGYYGVENLAFIPGTVGAAPIQNIGAYGVEVADRIVAVEGYDLNHHKMVVFSNQQCQFAYRDSIFKRVPYKNNYLVWQVVLQLMKKPSFNVSYRGVEQALMGQAPSLVRVVQAIGALRASKLPDPKTIPNAGSFFKNPLVTQQQLHDLKQHYPDLPYYTQGDKFKLPAAWLIEKSGLKGMIIDNCGVYSKQALVLVNHGHANGSALLALKTHIQTQVNAKFGILLECEVNIV